MLLRAQELSSIFSISSTSHCTICSNHSPSESLILSMRTAFGPLTLLRTLTLSYFHPNSRHIHRHSLLRTTSVETTGRVPRFLQRPLSTSADQLAIEAQNCGLEEAYVESEGFTFDSCLASTDLKHLSSTSFEVKELEELPEQWRRSKVAWLCKELPSHKPATLIRILNAQKKWITQEDCTYISVHCMRVRENEAGFRVYKWMMQQHWFRFDFALATKLADYMGKERKFTKCREIFDDIINQGRVPCESTFHILTVAYLSSPVQGCLEEACGIYNRMIQLGGYQPRLSLHNSLFRSLVSQPGGSSKQYLRQAEFIYHNLVTSRLEVHKDVYGGLIWLHSYQDAIDIERIISLREEMKLAGIEESKEVLLSILRICSKVNDVEEAERIWKILQSGNEIPSQAYVYKMETYAKVGQPMKSLEKFRQMKSPSTVAYHKIIEIFSKVQEIEFAESLMIEFRKSGLKPLMPSYIDLMEMYLNLGLHDKLGAIFSQCLEECLPNRTIYNIYLDSLVKIGNLGKAEEVFNQMHSNGAIGVNKRSCNFILSGYLSSGDHVKAEKIFDFMCQKKYDIEPSLMEKLDPVLRFKREVINKPMRLKLSKEQRETVIGLLLGGLRMESDENRKNHIIHFEFNENLPTHAVLKRHAYDQYHEWLNSFSKETDARSDDDVIPYRFSTIAHSYFSFYADQFWPSGIPMIPKLIHRWLSPRVLAYWYMYGGHRTPAGDILLKLKGNREGVERIVKTFKAKSFDCKVKQKGRVFWLGFFGSNSTWFWKLTEPYILDDLKDILKPGGQTVGNTMVETPNINFDSGSGSDGRASNYDDNDN